MISIAAKRVNIIFTRKTHVKFFSARSLPNGSLTNLGARIEAGRCLLCVDAPCASACPARTKPDVFLRQLHFDNPVGAAETVLDNNPLGGVCGTVCPVSKLCESACTRKHIDGPVKIGKVQRYLHDFGLKEKIDIPPVSMVDGHMSAVIGAGPAGLAAARDLARRGSKVTVFEKREDAGGALRYALSPLRVPHTLVDEEVDRIKQSGVNFVFNRTVCDISELVEEGYHAVFISPGLQLNRSVDLNATANQYWKAHGIVGALEFLDSANASDTKFSSERSNHQHVVIIGGGSVAMDCAITAKSLGAASVHIVARESLLALPADMEEIELAHKAGAVFHPQSEVKTVESNNTVIISPYSEKNPAVAAAAATTGPASGVESCSIQASTIIVAAGQMLDPTGKVLIAGDPLDGITVKHINELTSLSDKCFSPSPIQQQRSRIFVSGGDAIRGGGDTVVQAVADGKHAAAYMMPNSEMPKRHQVDLKTEFVGIHFINPFTLSSSPVTNSADMIARAYDAGFAGAYFKTLNRDDKFIVSHPSPRLNSVGGAWGHRHTNGPASNAGVNMDVGIQNVEQISDRPLVDNLGDITWLRKNYPEHITAASIMGFSDEDWAYLAAAAEGAGAHLLELNFSCPQMARSDAGHHIGQQIDLIERFTAVAKRAVSIPVIAKLTPNVADMIPAALAAQNGGADGVSAINTLKSISHVDVDTMHAQPNIQGHSSVSGYSGQGARPIGLRFVSDLGREKQLVIPISGMGGIYTWRHAAEYISVGASNLQVTTSVMNHGVRVVEDMIDGLQRHMRLHNISRVRDMVGVANRSLVDPSQLDATTEVVSVIDASKCVGCGRCEEACRDGAANAISMYKRDTVTTADRTNTFSSKCASVDRSVCFGCKLCQFVCPVDAISFEVRPRIERARFGKRV